MLRPYIILTDAHPPHRPRSRPRLRGARRPRVAVSGAACVPGSPRDGAGPAAGRRRERGEDRAGDGRRNEAGGMVHGARSGRGAACCAPTPCPWPPLVLRQRREHRDDLADSTGVSAAASGAPGGRLSRVWCQRRPGQRGGHVRRGRCRLRRPCGPPEVDPHRIFVYGRSLGSAAATYTATRHPVAGLILESPFTTAADMARDAYRILPRFILRLSLDNLGRIKQVRCPVLLFHGTDDRLVPVRMGMQVAAAAPGPVEVVLIQASGHNDTYDAGGESYRRKVAEFVR